MKYAAPRGTQDVLPDESHKWQWAEQTFRDVCRLHGYREIRTPTFEETDLFTRTIGDATDIVTKEMYTFEDRGGRSVTLRPEGTAPAVRAYVERSLGAKSPVNKLYYITSIFRYERPQAGRLREHHQFGVECIGSQDPAVDAEVISLGQLVLDRTGVKDRELKVSSIGCKKCRPAYREALQENLRGVLPKLCANCQKRFDTNPLRILDCKEDECRRLTEDAPSTLDYLDGECAEHFAAVRAHLDGLGIPHIVDRRLVRGLDYYTKTAFEFHAAGLGAQSQVLGGGRYDDLVEEIGGDPTPAIGFGMGVERLLLAAEKQRAQIPPEPPVTAFVAALGESARIEAVKLLAALRAGGIPADTDYSAKSLKAQMKLAHRLGARFVVILGEDEIARGAAAVRDMATGEQSEVALGDLVAKLSVECAEQRL